MRAGRALVIAAACVASAASGSAAHRRPETTLKVTYWENRRDRRPATKRWTFRCAPAGGTLRAAGVACRRLATDGAKLFAPVPREAVCTEIYGGPQVARVIGMVDGDACGRTFSRTNGCQIERWDRFSPWLLPRGG